MRQTIHLIIYTIVSAILMIGCTNNGSLPSGEGGGRGHVPQASDTLYTEKAAMDLYGTQPERALVIIDSAEIVGNLTGDRASLLRAKVFCLTCGEEQLDTARQICESLLQGDFVKDAPENREPVLDLLVTISRKKHDNEQWLRWATEKANFCRQQGNKTEALRTEAEIGVILTHLGRQDEGMKKLDDVIRRLDGTRKFNETDACIIALRRKTDVLAEQGLYADIIPLAEKIVEKMNDYEQHPDEFHDGTYREPDAADVPDYCDFYRTKGYAYLASAYANEGDGRKALGYLRLFEQSRWGQTIDGRKMIAPTWCKLGEYDKMLADSFGYYLSLGRVTDFLGADEILGIEIKNLHEVTIRLGGTTDEALATIGTILDLYDKDVDTTVEFQGRAATSGLKLGEPVTTTCTVVKKALGGKRLQFLFPEGKRQGRAYLSKSTLKELRANFKIDIKLHPKQHRK